MGNICFDQLAEEYGREDVERVTDLITDVLTSTQPTVRIGKEAFPTAAVRGAGRRNCKKRYRRGPTPAYRRHHPGGLWAAIPPLARRKRVFVLADFRGRRATSVFQFMR